jgi:CheY-like chemotaxis protein
VILVGEVRDAETASVSLQAASTGHLVLTTLHTNDAFGVLPRLSDLEIDHTVLADALRGIVAQRLLRRVCTRCARTIAPDDALTEAQQALSVRYGVRPTLASVGCDQCSGTGFRGRMVAAEVIEVTGDVAQAVRTSAPLDTIRAVAKRAGTRSMLDIALELVARGDTTLDEVHRVLGDTDTVPHRGATASPGAASRPAAVEAPSDVPIIEVLPIPDDVGRGRPAAQRRASAEPTAPGVAPALSPSLTSRWTGLDVGVAKPSVLIADQDVDDLLAFEAHLSGRGWRVTTAVDGEEARRFLMGEAFSLAVLRLRLPRISGRDLLQRMSAQGRTAMPIVLITNLTLDPNAERTLGEGAADFIHKPVTPAELERRCLAVLLRRSGEG